MSQSLMAGISDGEAAAPDPARRVIDLSEISRHPTQLE